MNARVFAVLATVLALAIIFGDSFLARRGDLPSPGGAEQHSAAMAKAAATVSARALPQPEAAFAPPASAPPERAAEFTPPPVNLTFGPTSWDAAVTRIVEQEKDPTKRSSSLLAMLPGLPEDALAEVTERAVDGLPDESYARTALPIVTSPAAAGQVLSVLFADLMERPDSITLPALLTIAREPTHPFAPAALDNLRLLLKADFGTNWSAWELGVQRKLSASR